MHIYGPLSQQELETRMAEEHLDPRIRMECKIECEQRRWLAPSLGYRANAAGELATVDYGPEPLSLQMAGLYRRVGLREQGSYSQQEVDEALSSSDLNVSQRMAIRHSLAMRRQVRASGRDTLDKQLTALRALQRRL
jgi:hypothetical protein